MTVTVRTLAICVALFLGGSAAGIWMLMRPEPSPSAIDVPAQGVPTEVTADELRSLASATMPMHWAGELARRRIEVTTIEGGAFVRYLPETAVVGDRTRALTIATYELARAWEVAQRAAREPDAKQRRLSDGRIATWRTSRPTSVYLTRPGSPILVEVYDPDAAKARHLTLTGVIQPVAEA